MSMSFGVALMTRLSQKICRLNRTCISYTGIKKWHYCFYRCFTYFYCYRHFKDYKVLLPVITICFLLFLPVPSHLQNSVAGKHDQFSFLYRYYWNYKIALPVAVILVLFNWRKKNSHFTLYNATSEALFNL